MPGGDVVQNTTILTAVGVFLTALYKALTGGWELARSWLKERRERAEGKVAQSNSVFEMAQRETVGWGTLMKEDNATLRTELAATKAELRGTQDELRVTQGKLGVAERSLAQAETKISDLEARLARLESSGPRTN